MPAITVSDLSKAYRIGLGEIRPATFTEAAWSWARAPLRNLRNLRRLNTFGSPEGDNQPDTLWALKNVSFDVQPGEVVGVIGRNGAGKSTLLKVLSRITAPTSGRVEIRGRVSSLLEVGTGFHPELTGRENIYMNGTILGMTRREIARKFDEIVEFSGVEKFLDTPVKRYSSGMTVRLAFAVAAHLEPEILIIDEVLAVGDAEFQKKCLGRMQDVAGHGRTILFVSHNMAAIESLCSRCVLMQHGQVKLEGDSRNVITAYFSQDRHAPGSHVAPAGDDRIAALGDAVVTDPSGLPNLVRMGQPVRISVSFRCREAIVAPRFHLAVNNARGARVMTFRTQYDNSRLPDALQGGTISCDIAAWPLLPGEYALRVSLHDDAHGELDDVDPLTTFEVVVSDVFGSGKVPLQQDGICYAACAWKVGYE